MPFNTVASYIFTRVVIFIFREKIPEHYMPVISLAVRTTFPFVAHHNVGVWWVGLNIPKSGARVQGSGTKTAK